MSLAEKLFPDRFKSGMTREELADSMLLAAKGHGIAQPYMEIHQMKLEGGSKTALVFFCSKDDHQTEIRIYGSSFVLFRVWRPFMGKDAKPATVVLKLRSDALEFFASSLIEGVWKGKLAA